MLPADSPDTTHPPSPGKKEGAYGTGIESKRAKQVRTADLTGETASYKRSTNQKAQDILKIIGKALFHVKTLQAIARDLEQWGVPRLPRDGRRVEGCLVRHLHDHLGVVRAKWRENGFSVQKRQEDDAAEAATSEVPVSLSDGEDGLSIDDFYA
jgi:ribosomal protein L35AE/L33A